MGLNLKKKTKDGMSKFKKMLLIQTLSYSHNLENLGMVECTSGNLLSERGNERETSGTSSGTFSLGNALNKEYCC